MSRTRHKKRCAQPRRHRMRKQARRASALGWIRSGARVTIKTYAKRYGVDRYTAHDDLVALGVVLPEADARWAVRPPPVPKPKARQEDPRSDGLDLDCSGWIDCFGRRMFVVDYTAGGFPIGLFEDEFICDFPPDVEENRRSASGGTG